MDDGGQTFYHSTGIQALPQEAERDDALKDKLEIHKLAMCKAYTLMQLKRMDMNDRIFEMQALLNAAFGEEGYKVDGL